MLSRFLRVFMLSFIVVLCASGLFFLLNFLSLQTDVERIVSNLRDSFENGNRTIANSRHWHSDCFIAAMVITRDESIMDLTISPKRIYGLEKPQICEGLKQLVYDSHLKHEYFMSVYYHQYLNGQRALLGFLLSFIGVETIRKIFFTACYSIVCTNIVILLTQIWIKFTGRNCSNMPNQKHEYLFEKSSLLIFSMGLLLFYDLPEAAASFRSAPTDVLLFAFLTAASCINFYRSGFLSRTLFFALFGTAIAYFEILHGAVTLAVALIIGVLSVQRTTGESKWTHLTVCAEALIAFGTGFLGCFVLKLAVVSLHFHLNMFSSFLDLLALRMTGRGRTSMPVELMDSPFGKNFFWRQEVSFGRVFRELAKEAAVFGFGFRRLGLWLVATALAINAFFAVLMPAKHKLVRAPQRLVGLIVSSLLIGLWYLVFLEHTQSHPRIMVRLLVWPIAVSGVLLVGWLSGMLFGVEQESDFEAHRAAR
jgi:hypothetical protein